MEKGRKNGSGEKKKEIIGVLPLLPLSGKGYLAPLSWKVRFQFSNEENELQTLCVFPRRRVQV